MSNDGVPMLPVATGLAAGIGLIVIFSLIFTQNNSSFVLVGDDKSFEIPYRFTEGGTINNMVMKGDELSLIAKVDVRRDGYLEIQLPKTLLKELEIKSGYHFCAGNEFVIFVSDEIYQPTYKEYGDKVSLTFPVKAGLQEVAFAGTDLMMGNPTCPP